MHRCPRPRHVGFNALFLDPGVSGGPETYLRGLVPALATEFPALESTRRHHAPRRARAARRRLGRTSPRSSRCPCDEGERARRRSAEQVLLPALAARGAVRRDALAGDVGPVRAPGAPRVVTLHDVTFFKDQHVRRRHHARRCAQPWSARRARSADALIAVLGGRARRDRASVLGLDPARFTVVHHGAGRPPGAPPATPDAVRASASGSTSGASCCASPRSGRTRTRSCSCARCRTCPSDVGARAGRAPRALRRGARARSRARARRGRPRAASPATSPTPSSRRCGGWPAAPRSRPAPRASGCRCSRRCTRGVPVACSDIPVLREVGGDARRTTSTPTTPSVPPRRSRRRSRDRRRRAAGAARAGRAVHVGGRRRAARAPPTSGRWRLMLHVGLNLVFLVPGETGGMEVCRPRADPGARRARRSCASPRSSTARRPATIGGVEDAVVVPVDARNRVQWVRGEQQLLPRLARRAGLRRRALARLDRAGCAGASGA